MTPTEVRLDLHHSGYCPLPLIGKRPVFEDWPKRTDVTEHEIAYWSRSYPAAENTGILTKFTPCFDIDIFADQEAAIAVETLARERFEEHGVFLTRVGNAPKRAIPFRTHQPFAKISRLLIAPGGKEERLEVLADGQQLAAFGTHPDTHKPYKWNGYAPGKIPRQDLPYIHAEEALALIEAAVELLVRDFGYQRARERPKRKPNGAGTEGEGTEPTAGAADWKYLLDNIREGRALHDSLRDLAAKMIRSGTNAGATVNHLRALMESSAAPHDERWKERFAEIPRLVESAVSLREEADNGSQGQPADDGPPPHDGARPGGASVASAPLFDPWERYIVPEFPFDILPGGLRSYVSSQAEAIGVDPSAMAMSSLTGISGALDHRFAVKMMRGGDWWEHPRLWTLLCGDPSTKKTPCANAATHLSVSLLGGIQPERLSELHGLTSDGLLQRFTPVMMRAATLARDIDNAADVENYHRLITMLIRARHRRMHLSNAALTAMDELRAYLFKLEQVSSALASGLQGFVGKLSGLAGRLAVVLRMVADPEYPFHEIDAEVVTNVRALILDFIIPHAREFYRTAEEMTDGERIRKIASWLITSKRTHVNSRDFARNVWCLRGLPLLDLQKQVSPLVAAGWLNPVSPFPSNAAWTVAPVVAVQFEQRRRGEEEQKARIAKLIGSPRRAGA